MGYYCSLCGSCTIETTITNFIRHLNYRHGLGVFQKVSLTCGQNDCMRSFDSIPALRKHLHMKHAEDPFPQSTTNINVSEETLNCTVNTDNLNFSQNDAEPEPEPEPDMFQMIADFVLHLRARIVNQSTVNFVTQSLEYLFASIYDIFQNKLKHLSNDYPAVSDVLSEFEETLHAFNSIKSDYNQKKYLKEKKGLIEPEETLLGMRCEQYVDRSKVSSLKYVPETIQYIPIKETISLVLNKCETLIHQKPLGSKSDFSVLKEYQDAKQFKTHPLFMSDQQALQLQLYFDEFETVNPLGPKTKIHKIGGLYMTIKNLPIEINSKLLHIHPVIYCYSQDISKYGFKMVFQKLLSDLKDLEDGVMMEINGKNQKIRGALVLWSGDNLGLHQVFGFCESFQATRPCHYCYTDKNAMQENFETKSFVLRTHENYLQDIENVKTDPESVKATGIKADYPLDELKYFRFPDNVCPDAMHDILEGSLQYTLKLILLEFTQNKNYFKMKLLNSRIRFFNFGVDMTNKPSHISREKLLSNDKKLGLNASQSWCFGRYLPLLIGDLVPVNEPCMEILHKILLITDYILAPKTSEGLTVCLEHEIVQYLTMFKTLFPEYSITPKQHYLLHYPEKIRELGPCSGYWCMRMEAKHAKSKEYAHIIHCFKNVCKSVAWDNQIKAAVAWSDTTNLTFVQEIGTGYVELPCRMSVNSEVFTEASLSLYEEVYVCNFVTINGVQYMPSQVLPVSFSHGYPNFAVVQQILSIPGRNETLFIMTRMKTHHYDTHLHAYAVQLTEEQFSCTVTSFVDFHPLHLADSFARSEDFSYVVLKYELLDEEECSHLNHNLHHN